MVIQDLISNQPEQTNSKPDEDFLNLLNRVSYKKYLVYIRLVIQDSFILETEALFDTGADLSCISEGLIPTIYFENTMEVLRSANGSKLDIEYKLSDVAIQFGEVSLPETFLLAKDVKNATILGTSFITRLDPYIVIKEGIVSLPFLPNPENLNISYKPGVGFVVPNYEKALLPFSKQPVEKILNPLTLKENQGEKK